MSAGRDPVTGKYIYATKTVEGGPRIANQALAELVVSARSAKTSITLARLIDEFFLASSGLALTTQRNYREIARRHVLPTLGSKRIEKITGRDLDDLYRERAEAGVGVASIRYAHALISRVLSQAVKWGWLEKNVAKMASPPTASRSVVSAPTPEELGQILTAALRRSPQLAAVLALCALTGVRRGEALALRWSDYDPMMKVLTISKSVGYAPGSGVFVKSTKTRSVRKIGVDEILESVVISQIEALQKSVDCGFDLVDDPYLFFGDPTGSISIHPDTPSKFFRKVCDSLGLPYHLHQLRHFTATQLIAAGVDVRTVSGRLGHADPSITLRVYSHVLEAKEREAAEIMGRLLGP